MTDVVFWLPAVNPYWNERFRALQADGRVSFSCWFNAHIDPMRSWVVDESTMSYPHVFLPERRRSRLAKVLRLYRLLKPKRIFTFHFDPDLWPVWIHRLRGGHVALYCLMTWDTWVSRSRPKEFAKRLFFSAASSTLTPGPDSDAWAKKYGARHLHRLHHAVDSAGFAEAAKTRQPSSALRLLFVGRLIPEKGIRFLQGVFDAVRESGLDVEMRIVGSGQLEQELRAWSQTHQGRVEISSFVQAEDMPAVYAGSDVLLFPTEGDPYGLVVDEALATGMPVISSDHAGDISWRLDNDRGVVCRLEDSDDWEGAIERYAMDRGLLTRASAKALSFSQGHDVSRWVEEIVAWRRETE